MLSETIQDFLARHEDETHTGQEWENLANIERLNQNKINELMMYLDDYH